jgi:hypothetical protein
MIMGKATTAVVVNGKNEFLHRAGMRIVWCDEYPDALKFNMEVAGQAREGRRLATENHARLVENYGFENENVAVDCLPK